MSSYSVGRWHNFEARGGRFLRAYRTRLCVLLIALACVLSIPAPFVRADQYSALAAGVGAFGVVVALGLAALSLYFDNRDGRVDRVLDMHAQYNDSDFRRSTTAFETASASPRSRCEVLPDNPRRSSTRSGTLDLWFLRWSRIAERGCRTIVSVLRAGKCGPLDGNRARATIPRTHWAACGLVGTGLSRQRAWCPG
jgi:hypothetical protein